MKQGSSTWPSRLPFRLRGGKLSHLLLGVLVVYYWLLAVFLDTSESYGIRGWEYFITVSAVCIYTIMQSGFLLSRAYKMESILFVVCGFIVAITSLIKSDVVAAGHLLTLCLPLAIVRNSDVRLDLRLVNTLFCFTVIASILGYYSGANIYGFVPGQSMIGSQNELWWRVSLFPRLSPPAGSFVALLVFLVNFQQNGHRFGRPFFLVLSMYFALLAGCRTTAVVLMYVAVHFCLLRVRPSITAIILPLAAVLILGGAIFVTISPRLVSRIDSENTLLNTFVFRTMNPSYDPEEIRKGAIRADIWDYHIAEFLANPIVGARREMIENTWSLSSDGGESYLTSLLARHGLPILLLVAGLGVVYLRAVLELEHLRAILCVLAIVFMLFYGSFIKTYTFPFLLLIGLLNSNEGREPTPALSSNSTDVLRRRKGINALPVTE
ncbi:MAG: hypothetical protein L0Z50_21120 [Verrucomicrobiales bacterium]|nr:hypothetical protein [Verrucomicrobiales bacterium]